MKALVVDDERNIRQVLKVVLEDFGFETLEASSVKEAISILTEEAISFILVDLKLPDGTGIDILRFINERELEVESVIITAFASSNTAVEAMKLGAYDYITKPFDLSELKLIVRNVKEKLILERKLHEREKVEEDEFIGNSPPILKLKETVKKIAPYDVDVLIVGESGTGKEVIAKRIHKLSNRKNKPFIAINCASLPSELLESELFGYKKGAFTGATSSKLGLIKAADGGTLFLDEIGDMPLKLQAKLLRFLEEREVRPLGSTDRVPVNVRVIAATNKDIEGEVEKGNFREDFYYRLSKFIIRVPPLRQRREDIPLLVEHFIKVFSQKYGKKIERVDTEFIEYLMSHPLKGNVRELKNIVEREVILSDDGKIDCKHCVQIPSPYPLKLTENGLNLKEALRDLEIHLIKQALEIAGNDREKAAKLLGLTLRELRYRISKYKLR